MLSSVDGMLYGIQWIIKSLRIKSN